MSPGRKRAAAGSELGGAASREPGEVLATARIATPLGEMVAGATAAGIAFLEFGDKPGFEALDAQAAGGDSAAHLRLLAEELARYFAGTLRAFRVPLDARGTPFQERVWRELVGIPYGATRSYEEIARRVKTPAAVRAVGHANGRNPIAVVVPCHRVINKSGRLGGYGGGLWRKEWLLDRESGRIAFDRSWLGGAGAGTRAPSGRGG